MIVQLLHTTEPQKKILTEQFSLKILHVEYVVTSSFLRQQRYKKHDKFKLISVESEFRISLFALPIFANHLLTSPNLPGPSAVSIITKLRAGQGLSLFPVSGPEDALRKVRNL
jgi:hypothetical protein